ncbi:TetR/AcrR family transcriptional regulator [Nocardia cyriacigeorgica]|uniref:TetR/AcrR family transcriptional regulator n=2 Tax=Nocardia cyriacigeorgica TaxID=135487 RepID=A0A6P1DHF7_9NOCA|nr:TetR/AcrR family transcriptional regulator [Nocardia cyriacigeorgica]NEW48013.1 TetR/AcrR family transcriptional regulator [Nocardia cyriacigeorgica]NEW53827.1 TetR/AcrR family transcriptional regulator [Nocardia cyriacigeorgica]NEW59492.1 TetR/AcrR family transcriptional regulator [Nocardia cyriacigeorgica]
MALEEAGLRLFTERGFAGTSAEELVGAAGVTRGALHHHYGDKRGLFLAVLEQLETDATVEITQAIEAVDPDDLLTAMATGLATFLEICRRPAMVRIALSDAPAVLGWQAWREFEAKHGLGLITDQLERARAAGLVPEVPVRVMAQLILSAVAESGLIVAHSHDPDTARLETQQSLMLLVAGILRTG